MSGVSTWNNLLVTFSTFFPPWRVVCLSFLYKMGSVFVNYIFTENNQSHSFQMYLYSFAKYSIYDWFYLYNSHLPLVFPYFVSLCFVSFFLIRLAIGTYVLTTFSQNNQHFDTFINSNLFTVFYHIKFFSYFYYFLPCVSFLCIFVIFLYFFT